MSYPVLLDLYYWCKSGDHKAKLVHEPTFSEFSSAYTALLLYIIIVAICSKKNMGVFIRMGSLAAIFVAMLVMFVIGIGIYGIHTTEF